MATGIAIRLKCHAGSWGGDDAGLFSPKLGFLTFRPWQVWPATPVLLFFLLVGRLLDKSSAVFK